tara:strand:- start:4161 stop:4391 length:231 start_codon:yes stop_codon:yes gene_type:complete
MATVIDKSGNGGGTTGSGPENEYARVSVVASALIGTTVPSYVGQKGTDFTDNQNYIAQRPDPSSTVALTHAHWARF